MKLIDILKKELLSEGLLYHLDKKVPLNENIYRPESTKFFSLFKEAREAYGLGVIDIDSELDKTLIVETDLGEFDYYNGIKVPLDYPMTEEYLLTEALYQGKEVSLNKPKRNSGSGKKFVVFVKDPKTKKVKKVTFGDKKGGLSIKISDPKARKAFADRHRCSLKKDKTTSGWWSCRINRYGSLIGGKNYPGFW